MARRSVSTRVATTIGFAAILGFGLVVACVVGEDDSEFRGDVTPRPEAWIPAPLPAAHCEILVEGKGVKELEADYLPHVITCENGGANLEAMKAQAIAARSVAYYYIDNQGSVCDSQGCQVYTCAAEPSALAYQAVAETSGMYLNFNEVLTYAFFVAGDPDTQAPSCVGTPGVGTEGWVTYNEAKTGDEVTQTDLGWVFEPGEPGFGQNRGCMSQWGGRCLENDLGYDYLAILRFYYGDDINVTQAQGPCVTDFGGDGDGDGDGDAGGDGDGDGEAGGDGDGDGDGDCNVGALDCMCTHGGGCDPGLICEDLVCVPDDASEGTGESGGLTAGFQDDAFEASGGCECSASDAERERGGLAMLVLGLAGWLGVRRRRDRS